MRIVSVASVLACLFVLSACGGGGGVASTPPPAAGPTPTPPASPTPPAPTPPAPTPPAPPPPAPPPPPPTNTAIDPPTISETFAADAVRYTGTSDGRTFAGVGGGAAALEVRYDAVTRLYTVAVASGPDIALGTPAASNGLYEVFRSSSASGADDLRLTRVGALTLPGTRYVAGGVWLRQSGPSTAIFTQANAFTFGVATPAADVPRSGSGSFGVVLTAIRGGSGRINEVNGSGLFAADFGSGWWTVAGTTTSRSSAPSGGVPILFPDVFSGSGTLKSGGLGFDGRLSIGFPGLTNNEVVAGRFYGPGAGEVGASFGDRSLASDSFVVGTFVGRRGTTAPVIETLSSLLGPGSVPYGQFSLRVDTSGSGLGRPPSVEFNGGIESRVAIDPAAQTLDFDSGFPIGPANRVAAESNARITVYRTTGGTVPLTFRVYNAGAGNPELPLDFVSFALTDRFGLSATYFGMRSSFEYLPRAGRGTFDGVFYGDALSAGTTNRYELRGLASLTADFGAQTIGGSFTAAATFSGTTTDLGSFTFTNGRIGEYNAPNPAARPGNFFTADIVGAPETIGALNGSFYGPAVQELGAVVKLVTPGPGVTLLGQGIIVAKRGPIDGTPASSTPPAPPPPVNTSLDPLTRSDAFVATAQRASAVYPGNGTSPRFASATPLTVRYDATTQSYTVEEGGGSATFAPADQVGTSNRLADLFQITASGSTDTLRLTKTGSSGAALTRYVAGGIWNRDATAGGIRALHMRSFVFGIPTARAEVPLSGSAKFGVVLTGIQPVGEPSLGSNLTTINGSGLMTVDWGGQITMEGVTYARSGLTSGPALLVPGSFQYMGGSGPSGVRGFLTFSASSTSTSGEANGAFYGPNAGEVGLSYATTSGTPIRSGVGVIMGARATSAPAFETLTSLLSDVGLSSFVGKILIPAPSQGVPAEGPSARNGNVTLGVALDSYIFAGAVGPGDLVAAESDARFTTFRVSNSLGTTTTRVYRAGTGNTELPLSYASLAVTDFIASSSANLRTSSTYAFGLPTLASALPRTGTGSYRGVVYGSGYIPGTANDAYALRGTTNLTFDWATATFGGGMALTAQNDGTGISETLGAISFANGTLNRATAGFASTLGGSAGVSGDLLGSFFGPMGQELGGSFRLVAPVAAGNLQAQGAIVATPN